ncbi:MAG: response regulator [Anaerostipes sp.]|jgi:signal transduction histidine kinase/CheY-like chemotaxis protein
MNKDNEIITFLESFQHTGIYIVDRETLKVYYENGTARKYTIVDRIGQPCYQVHGNTSMCASCPLRNKDRKTFVNREDHHMIFSVSAKETMWKGIPTYTIIVEKERDLPKRKSLPEASLERMNRALHSSVISYVDVNMGTGMCQAIHFSKDGNHKIYNMLYDEYMRAVCFNEKVFPEDRSKGERVLGIENFQKLSEDSEGENEISIRYRVHGEKGQIHVLKCTAYVLRDELPHHISIIGKEVSQEEKRRVQLSLYNKLMSSAVTTYQLNLTQNTFQTSSVVNHLNECKSVDELYDFIVKHTVGDEEKEKAKRFLNRQYQLKMFEKNQSILRVRLPIDMNDEIFMWLDITYNLVRNPVSKDVEGILYSEAVDQDVISENMIYQMIENDYDYLAVFDLINHTNTVYTGNSKYSKKEMERNLSQENRETYFRKIYAGEDVDTFIYHNSISYIRKQLSEKDKFDNYYPIREEDGTISYKKETLSYLNGDWRFLLLSRTDNTDTLLNQDELNLMLTKALESARKATEERRELFTRMSHDLRTPMNGILGMIALSKKEKNFRVIQENINQMEKSGEYMLRMINDTLDMKRIETGQLVLKPVVVKCSMFIETIEAMVRTRIEEKNLTFQVVNKNINLDRYARVDAVRMKQIFINIISNAMKYTPEGGVIELSMECLKHENGIDYDLFQISDTGIGMSREFQRTKVFLPYAQENNHLTGKYAGPGLGLAITKSLVELMGGRIEVESELGEGSTFKIYLDIEIVDTDEAKVLLNKDKDAAEKAGILLRGKRILLCEDHPLNAQISENLLKKVGCQVIWAKDGKEGVECFEQSEEYAIDAILMDIQMPQMDGIMAATVIRNLLREDAKTVPIIAMTANAFEEDREATKKAGMNAHLAKPVKPAVLYETLMNLNEKENYYESK